jgi:glycosidase
MYLIQDIVANHTGNFFTYRDEKGQTKFDPADPAANVHFNTGSVPVTRPSQPPFDQNDPTDPAQHEAAIYHWTPAIENYQDPEQVTEYQLSDLDDLNTENPAVRAALKNSYGYWIENVGVDGFRVDTVRHVEHDFWHDFEYSEDPAAPGMTAVAASTGRADFLTFGEAFVDAQPLDDAGDRAAGSFTGTPDQPELDAALNFPMHWTISRVFAEGMPTNYATYSLEVAQDETVYRNPAITPNFIDNHDVARFLAKGSSAGLKQATFFLLTIPGIPVLYYGTEQAFAETRAAMFADGWASGGMDHFDPDAELYRHIRTLADIRTGNPVFTRGTLTPLADNAAGPGVLAYRRDYEGASAIVLFNTADQPLLLVDLDTGLPAGTVLDLAFGLVNQDDLVVGRDGKLTLELAPREGMILLPTAEIGALAGGGDAEVTVASDLSNSVLTADFTVTGTASAPQTPVKVIVNGALGSAYATTTGEDGIYEVTIPISIFPPGQTANTVVAYAPELRVVSASRSFTTEVTATAARAVVYDLVGDDVGPAGTYTLPTDETFSQQMDILRTGAAAYGTNLLVEVDMADLSTVWNPRNGFDHVAFHVFIDLPGREGVTVLPRLNADAPAGFAWDYLAFVEGWNNRFSSAEGAGPDSYGTPVTPAPQIAVDPGLKRISFLFPAAALGYPETLDGTRVYVTTWDWNGVDNAYRPLKEVAEQWSFGGGDGAMDPLILDATDVVPVTQATVALTVDPADDDYGPFDPRLAAGRYTRPTAPEYGKQMDLRRVTATAGAEEIVVALQMGEVTTAAGAPNGFDHVRFHVFLDVPGQEGAAAAPRLNLQMPTDFAWDYLSVVDGWTNALYTPDRAGSASYGAETGESPTVTVDPEAGVVELTFPAGALGNPESLASVKVYVTTWDWDQEAGALSPLTPEGGDAAFGGGGGDDDDGAQAPLFIDDALVGLPAAYRSSVPAKPTVDVTWEVTAPAATPAAARLYLTGPFNSWKPKDSKHELVRGEDGVYRLTKTFDAGTTVEFRITRGSFANVERIDPNDQLANRTLEVPADATALTVPLTVEGWWDQ